MALIAHIVALHTLTDKEASKLKYIAQAWMQLDKYQFVINHGSALTEVCPLCVKIKER